MNEYLAMWKNFFNFSGRTGARGFWIAILFNVIVSFVLSILMCIHGAFGILSLIYSVAAFIPEIALEVRRLHDINKCGWWILLSLIPCVGVIILIIWFCKASVETGNNYGTEQV